MNAPATPIAAADAASAMRSILDRQKAANLRDGAPSLAQRRERIDRCITLLIQHRREIEDALNTDFGSRSKEATAFTDIAASIGPLKHARDNLARWMKPERRPTTPALLGLFGAKAEVRFQPKGVVGGDQPVEFPGEPHLRAPGRRSRRRQPGHDQAV